MKWADVERIFDRDGGVDIGPDGMGLLALQSVYWDVIEHFGDRAVVTMTSSGHVRAKQRPPLDVLKRERAMQRGVPIT